MSEDGLAQRVEDLVEQPLIADSNSDSCYHLPTITTSRPALNSVTYTNPSQSIDVHYTLICTLYIGGESGHSRLEVGS